MSADPRAALALFVNALERHLELTASGRGADDPRMDEVTDALADAFDAYDEALYDNYRTTTPFFLPADDDDAADDYDADDDFDADDEEEDAQEDDDQEEDDDLDEDEDDDEPYSGFGDDDFDFDEDDDDEDEE